MWKKQLAGFGIFVGFLWAFLTPVYAGDINAAEQRIVDYYNGTVTYDGKTYYFTEEAKQKAYNKLIADDVDLTEREVDSAIRQANANLKRGIEEGYMKEVGSDDGTKEPETELPDTQEPDTQESGTQESMTGDGSDYQENVNDGGLSQSTGDTNGTASENGGESIKKPTYPDMQKRDVENLVREALKEGEYASVKTNDPPKDSAQNQGWVATVKQFLKGTVDVVTENGNLVFSSGLAIKNTGYHIRAVNIVAGMAAILCMILIAVTVRKGKAYFAVPILTAAAGITAVMALMGGFWESELGKWKSLWILGAPEYTYAAETGDTDSQIEDGIWQPPLQGEQYGEILCEDIALKAPLYYGDTDEILEQGAGTYPGRSLPGQGGEILIGGHDTTFFAPLESMQKGTSLTIHTSYGTYTYEVTGTEIMDVMEYEARKPDTEELALYTCYPFGENDKLRNQRFFVYAKKVSGPEIGE